jgi:glycosyltransferase involved in cell wall biosynthesis
MDVKKIRTHGVMGTYHSWAVTMRSLLGIWIEQGHECFIRTTNSYDKVPSEWEHMFDKSHNTPDLDICYTLPRNFKSRFMKGAKTKMAIYNYETSHLPAEWVKEAKHVDYLLPSSNFSKEVFVNAGIPEEKCIVVPHGINIKDYDDKRHVVLGNKKTFRFLNVSIPHYRKNINVLLEAYYTAFDEDDDVCLVLKTNLNPPKNRKRHRFEAEIAKQIMMIQKYYKKKGKGLPQVEIIQQKFDSMIPLYNSCDCLVSASSAEGFGLPLLEGMAADMVVISPRCTGQLDFLNDNNSVLYDVKEVPATDKYQYWRPSDNATTFMPHKNDLAEAMLLVYNNQTALREKFADERAKTLEKFTWENAANQIMELV